jgi:hypothetical protein
MGKGSGENKPQFGRRMGIILFVCRVDRLLNERKN